jgi:hypothetical protein
MYHRKPLWQKEQEQFQKEERKKQRELSQYTKSIEQNRKEAKLPFVRLVQKLRKELLRPAPYESFSRLLQNYNLRIEANDITHTRTTYTGKTKERWGRHGGGKVKLYEKSIVTTTIPLCDYWAWQLQGTVYNKKITKKLTYD